MTPEEKRALQLTAVSVREGILTSTHGAKAGHPGGSLSAADVFTYLYFKEMNVDPKNPKWEERDRFVLSKGHTAPGLYAALALEDRNRIQDMTDYYTLWAHQIKTPIAAMRLLLQEEPRRMPTAFMVRPLDGK